MRRRDFLALATTGLMGRHAYAQDGLPLQGSVDTEQPKILALFSFNRGTYYFNPAGRYVQLGDTVEWALGRRTVIAYHPDIDNHELRIPETATPFDSRTAKLEGGVFRWTFEVEGTYDYYCAAQEYLGMVGRIVVGRPAGPAGQPPGYGNRQGRQVVYADAARMLNYLDPGRIVEERVVPCPLELLQKNFPWR